MNNPEFQALGAEDRGIVFAYLSTISSDMRARIFADANPFAGEEQSSNQYLGSRIAAERDRLFREVDRLIDQKRS
jgi:hypothetical protein